METPAEALFRAAHSAAADCPTQGLSNGGGGGGGGWDASAAKGLFTISAPSVADCSGLGQRKSRSPPVAAQGGLATTSLPAGDLPLFPHSGASGRPSSSGPAAAQGGLGTISAPHVAGPPPCMPEQTAASVVIASKAFDKPTWCVSCPGVDISCQRASCLSAQLLLPILFLPETSFRQYMCVYLSVICIHSPA